MTKLTESEKEKLKEEALAEYEKLEAFANEEYERIHKIAYDSYVKRIEAINKM